MVATLGYVEPVDEDFHNEPFPNKIGGMPKWLDPAQPLRVEQAQCDECEKPMALLMQLYAPEDEPADAFHRMLYVFVCRNGSCHKVSAKRCMRVFRAQLAEKNRLYTDQDGDTDEGEGDVVWSLGDHVEKAPVCVVCGLAGTKTCSKCHKSFYCSRVHQLSDWDAGHRSHCSSNTSVSDKDIASYGRKLERMRYPEQIIVTEEEGDNNSNDSEDEGEDAEGIKPDDLALVPMNDEKVEDSGVDVDSAFLVFQRRMQKNPDQIIRYERDGEPLLVSDLGKPDKTRDIPECGQCGATREFEFQVMPQMLNFLNLDSTDPASIDWGTLLVYTCPNSCSSSSSTESSRGRYVPEVVFRQSFSSHGIGEKYIRAMHGDDSGFTRQFDSLKI